METSTNFGFNLPSRDNDDIADINQISDNFRIIDEIMKETDQTFSGASENPQSGTAVAEALSDYVPKAIAQAIDTCSPAIVITSDTGKALSIPDSSESVIKGLTAYGESTQDGTPAPDSPVEIESIENPVISVYGKNLFDPQLFINGGWSSTGEGVYSGLASVLYRAYPDGLPFKFEVGKKYTFSFDGKCDQTSTGDMSLYFVFNYTDGSNTTIRINSADFKHYTATSTKDVKSLALAYNKSIQTYIKNFQLEISSAETPYEPYKNTQTVTLPYTFRGLKNTSGDWVARDELRVGNGKVEIVRNVGTYTFNGTEEWNILNLETPSCIWTLHLQDKTIFAPNQYCLSSKLQGQVSASSGTYNNNSIWLQSTDQFKRTYIALQGKWTSVVTAKQWLASNNIDIQYVNAVAEIEDITATEAGQALLALKANYPTTSVISDIDLNLTYRADTKNYIDNKIAALTALTLEG